MGKALTIISPFVVVVVVVVFSNFLVRHLRKAFSLSLTLPERTNVGVEFSEAEEFRRVYFCVVNINVSRMRVSGVLPSDYFSS